MTAGYFAVAPDHYVQRKVKQMEPWMTAAARTELCKAVAKDRGWLISAAEFEGWKRCGKATGLGISILICFVHSVPGVLFCE